MQAFFVPGTRLNQEQCGGAGTHLPDGAKEKPTDRDLWALFRCHLAGAEDAPFERRAERYYMAFQKI
jgi:hypothetical protein